MSVESDMPMFGFLVLSFLLLCTILAFAIWFATRGAADPGRSRVNGPAGCAIAGTKSIRLPSPAGQQRQSMR